MAEYVPLFGGFAVSMTASAAITAGKPVCVSATGKVGPMTAAGDHFVGIAGMDAAGDGSVIPVFISGVIHRLVASGTVTAAELVDAATAGKVATHTNGTTDVNIVGLALTTATDATVEILVR